MYSFTKHLCIAQSRSKACPGPKKVPFCLYKDTRLIFNPKTHLFFDLHMNGISIALWGPASFAQLVPVSPVHAIMATVLFPGSHSIYLVLGDELLPLATSILSQASSVWTQSLCLPTTTCEANVPALTSWMKRLRP